MGMNIYSNRGDKVVFTGKGGREYDQIHAHQILTVGNVYTVDYTEVSGWHTDVYLIEVTANYPSSGHRVCFNSVMFEDHV